jgi:nucleoside 2-deoxyribosyltransferase
MKIYFAGSIRGGRHDQKLYLKIISLLNAYGTVLTEHVGDAAIFEKEEGVSDTAIFQQDIDWLKQADLVVAEVTSPSLGVGYEIGIAESLGKPTLCIYRTAPDKQLSAMMAGNPALTVREYQDLENLSDLKAIIENFLSNF